MDFSSIWSQLLCDLFDCGSNFMSDKGECLELLNVSFCIDPHDVMLRNPRRNINHTYAWAEFLWYMSRTNSIEMIKHYAPQYVNYSDDGVSADGAYGYRLAHNNYDFDQLDGILKTLMRQSKSRQAVVNIWSAWPDLNRAVEGNSKDLPCTICWHFQVRFDRLFMTTYMRSNDAWLGTPYDVFAFTRVQRMLATELKIGLGIYTHHVGSFHLYKKHWNAAREAIKMEPNELPRCSMNDEPFNMEDVNYAIADEQLIRKGDQPFCDSYRGLDYPMKLIKEHCDAQRKAGTD